MKALLFLLALAFGTAHAAQVAVRPPSNVTSGASGYSSNVGSVFSGSAFNAGFTTNVGGKSIIMPATMRMAANAGQFAVNAMRISPQALVVGAVATWLIEEGLQYIDGQWQKVTDISAPPIYDFNTMPRCGVDAGASLGAGQFCWVQNNVSTFVARSCATQPSGWTHVGHCQGGNLYSSPLIPKTPSCPAGTTYSAGMCVGTAVTSPTESDWNALHNKPLTDAVANSLTQNGVALPLENPDFTPNSVLEPLSDAFYDPMTGTWKQKNVTVTPSADGKTAEAVVTEQEVNPDGSPKTDEEGNPAPEESPEGQCDKYPDSLGCMDPGEADDSNLESVTAGSSISPVSVGGGGSCPADQSITLVGGGTVVFTWQPICTFANMINPVVLALAWLLGGYILIGALRNE